MSDEGSVSKDDFAAKNDSETSMRSVTSDLENVPTNRKRRESKTNSTASQDLPGTEKEASNRPYDFAFTQQKLYGWQPILTPYNVLPVLFILGLIFVPLGAVFLSASFSVVETTFDYTTVCANNDKCEITLNVPAKMVGPVFVYYKLTNYYQNNRLYAKSFSAEQLGGKPLTVAQLASSCDPLVGDGSTPYYPCGLIANSFFSDIFSDLKTESGSAIAIGDKFISWPADQSAYKQAGYESPSDVLPPPSWLKFPEELKAKYSIGADGKYTALPDLSGDERFINWMKVAGFPTFRKLYGRIDATLEKGKYTLLINSNYDVNSFGGTKSVVLSTTTWAGGENSALGWSFIVVGGILLALGIFFLGMFMMSPRKVGDVSYLSWYNENLGDIIEEDQ